MGLVEGKYRNLQVKEIHLANFKGDVHFQGEQRLYK